MAIESRPTPDLFTISVGNTHTTVVGWYENGKPAEAGGASLTSIHKMADVANSVRAAKVVVIAGVVPKCINKLVRHLKDAGEAEPLIFRKDIPAPIEIIPEPPERVGDDRIAAALGALSLDATCPWVVVDVGTAVTCNAVTPGARAANDKAARGTPREGGLPRFEGGLIVPGAALALQALAKGTAQLPQLTAEVGDGNDFSFIGRNTEQAMRWGVQVSQVATVLAMIEGQRAALGPNARVAVTGGGAVALKDALRLAPAASVDFTFNPYLVHFGLFAAWQTAGRGEGETGRRGEGSR